MKSIFARTTFLTKPASSAVSDLYKGLPFLTHPFQSRCCTTLVCVVIGILFLLNGYSLVHASYQTGLQKYSQRAFSEALTIWASDLAFYKSQLVQYADNPQKFQYFLELIVKTLDTSASCYIALNQKENAKTTYQKALFFARKMDSSQSATMLQTKILQIQSQQSVVANSPAKPKTQKKETKSSPTIPGSSPIKSHAPMHDPKSVGTLTYIPLDHPQSIEPIPTVASGKDVSTQVLPQKNVSNPIELPNISEANTPETMYQALLNKDRYTISDIEACLEASRYFMEQGERSQALVYLIQAKNLAESLGNASTQREVYFACAEIHEFLQNNNEALMYYDKVLMMSTDQKNDDRIGEVLFRISNILVDRGELARARKLLEKSLMLSANPPILILEIRLSLGMICFSTKDYDGAIQHFTNYLTQATETKDVYSEASAQYWLGLSYLKTGKTEKGKVFLIQSRESFISLNSPDFKQVDDALKAFHLTD